MMNDIGITNEAARRLQTVADNATPGPWEAFRRGDPTGPFGVCPEWAGDLGDDVFDSAPLLDDAVYIAQMHPAVAVGLSVLLRKVSAAMLGSSKGEVPFEEDALAIAKTVLGIEG